MLYLALILIEIVVLRTAATSCRHEMPCRLGPHVWTCSPQNSTAKWRILRRDWKTIRSMRWDCKKWRKYRMSDVGGFAESPWILIPIPELRKGWSGQDSANSLFSGFLSGCHFNAAFKYAYDTNKREQSTVAIRIASKYRGVSEKANILCQYVKMTGTRMKNSQDIFCQPARHGKYLDSIHNKGCETLQVV